MTLVIAAVVALVIVAGVVGYVIVGRRRGAGAASRSNADVAPIGGLEAALDGVIGRDGRPLREKIDAEAAQVDSLRVDDDTGPLLRRALDHVAGDQGHGTDAPPADSGTGTAGRPGAGGTAPDERPDTTG